MIPPRSIRLRLTLATAGVMLLTGAVFGMASYWWLQSSLDGETRGFALHEVQEIANVVAALRTPDEVHARRELFSGLFPEEGVVGLAVFDLDGRLVESLPHEPGPWSEPWPEGFEAAKSGHTPYARVSAGGVPSLRTAMLVQYQREPRWLATSLVSEQRTLAALARYREVYGVGLVGAVAVAISGCLVLLSFALRPLARMVDDAARLADGAPGNRLEEPPEGSELRELATLLNQLLERHRRTVDSLRHFTAHAGHELRTPLARIRSEAELALVGSADQQRECIGSILEETQELGGVVDALLELARAEEADLSDAEPFPIRPLLEELAEQARVVGEPRDVSLTMQGVEPEPWVNGYRVLLDRAIWNLLDNALKFGMPGGRVELRMRTDAEWIVLEVADDGPGLTETQAESLFQAFRRGPARASAKGHGLGLALSRVVLRRHGGDVSVRRDETLGGACFSVRLPRSPKPPAPA